MKRYLFLALLLSLPVNTLQAADEIPKNDNFILYISNQSFAVNPVDIMVFIDGSIVVDQEFDVAGRKMAQHSWERFQFSLPPGKHTIRAVSSKGETQLEQDFDIVNDHWAVINYWYYPEVTGGAGPTPRSFEFTIKDEPILFK